MNFVISRDATDFELLPPLEKLLLEGVCDYNLFFNFIKFRYVDSHGYSVARGTISNFVTRNFPDMKWDFNPQLGFVELVKCISNIHSRIVRLSSLLDAIPDYSTFSANLFQSQPQIAYSIIMYAFRDRLFSDQQLMDVIESVYQSETNGNQTVFDACYKLLSIFPNYEFSRHQIRRNVTAGVEDIVAVKNMVQDWRNRANLTISLQCTPDNVQCCVSMTAGVVNGYPQHIVDVVENRRKLFYTFPSMKFGPHCLKKMFAFRISNVCQDTTLIKCWLNCIDHGPLHIAARMHFPEYINYSELSDYLFNLFEAYSKGEKGDPIVALEIENYLKSPVSVYDRCALSDIQSVLMIALAERVRNSTFRFYDDDPKQKRAVFYYQSDQTKPWGLVFNTSDYVLITAFKCYTEKADNNEKNKKKV